MFQSFGDLIVQVNVQSATELLEQFSNYQLQKDLFQSVRLTAGR